MKKPLFIYPFFFIGVLVVAGMFVVVLTGMEPGRRDTAEVLLPVEGVVEGASGEGVNHNGNYRDAIRRNYMIFTPEVPAEASFAGERVPLEQTMVWESLDREILAFTYMHSSTLQLFKLAHRYFRVIEPILKAHGIPDDFKFLAVAESNLRNATSPAGAEGIWQFLPATARKYGLEVNAQIDERYNLEKATVAACQYLQEAYDLFGNWTLAAAAYNRGMNGLQLAVMNQKVDNYYDIYLNDETARYVYRIIAAKEVWNNPARYGFYLRECDFYPPVGTYTLAIDTTINDLPFFALQRGLTYKIIREFNPWIHGYSLPNKSGKRYLLTLPEKDALVVPSNRYPASGEERFFHDTLRISDIL